MHITEKDIKIIQNYTRSNPNKLSIGYYYIKRLFLKPQYGINELIGYHLACLFDLETPLCHLVEIDDSYYLLSEYVEFKNMASLGLNHIKNASLYEIWRMLDKYHFNSQELMFQIIKMYLFDFLFGNSDRNYTNYGIVTHHNKSNLIVYDHEYLFNYNRNVMISSFYDGNQHYKNILSNEKVLDNKKDNLEEFFRNSDKGYLFLCKHYLDIWTPDYFKEVLDEVENSNVIITVNGNIPLIIPNKEQIIKNYTDNYNLIIDVFEQCHHHNPGIK